MFLEEIGYKNSHKNQQRNSTNNKNQRPAPKQIKLIGPYLWNDLRLNIWLSPSFASLKQEVKIIWQKAPHGGPIPRLGVIPGGRKLYHWIPGVEFPISVP